MLNDTDMHIPNRLLCSQLIFRHGSRTPLYVLPQKHKDVHHNACTHSKYGYNQDFYGKELFYPFPASETVKLQLIKEKQAATRSQRDYFTSVGIDPDVRLKGGAEFGALTTLGRKQLYALGQKIYDMHKSCGNVLESFKNVQAHSSYVTRTLDSVQSFLSGMLSRFSIVDYEANSYPDNIKVPVRVESFDHDFIFPNFIATPVLHRDILELYDKLPSDHELKQIRYKFLKEYDMINYDHGILELNDELSCRKSLKLPMSDDLLKWQDIFLANTTKEFNYIYGYQLSHEDFMKATVGRLIKRLTDVFTKHRTENSEPLLYVYSSHDSTLHCLNMALGQLNREWPNFASYLLIQLFTNENGPYIKIIYNDEDIPLDGNLSTPLDVFLQKMQPFCLTDEKLNAFNEQILTLK